MSGKARGKGEPSIQCTHGKASAYKCKECHLYKKANGIKTPSYFCDAHDLTGFVCKQCFVSYKDECTEKGIQPDPKKFGFCLAHGKQKTSCKDCPKNNLCPHNRQKTKCKECGGEHICEHDRLRILCMNCGGGSLCPHGRPRPSCKDCKGVSICDHNRLRVFCKDCHGKNICEHGRQKYSCKECGGSSICEHNRQRVKCKDCHGSSRCKHNKMRYACKEAVCQAEMAEIRARRNGSRFTPSSMQCYHGKDLSKCKTCAELKQTYKDAVLSQAKTDAPMQNMDDMESFMNPTCPVCFQSKELDLFLNPDRSDIMDVCSECIATQQANDDAFDEFEIADMQAEDGGLRSFGLLDVTNYCYQCQQNLPVASFPPDAGSDDFPVCIACKAALAPQ